MTEVLSTIGVVVLFLAIFGVCVLWATHGHPGEADNEGLSVVAKDSLRVSRQSRSRIWLR